MFMTKRRHEAETESLRDEISRLRSARMMDAETIRQQDARHRVAVTDLEKLSVLNWASHIGDPPDGDSPLLCVYDAGIGYAYDRLADWLGVDEYEFGDGSEEYATDVGRTGANVLVAAGFVNDDGNLLTATDMAALKSDAEKWRARADREKTRGERRRGRGQ